MTTTHLGYKDKQQSNRCTGDQTERQDRVTGSVMQSHGQGIYTTTHLGYKDKQQSNCCTDDQTERQDRVTGSVM